MPVSGDGAQGVNRDLVWLWFELRGSHMPSRRSLEPDADLAKAVLGLESELAAVAESNRRAARMFLAGMALSLVTVAAWRALVYEIVFPLYDAGRLGGEAQYWIVWGTVWIPYAALILCVLALASVRYSYRLSVTLGQVYSALSQMSFGERNRIRSLMGDDSRFAHLLRVNRRWRVLFDDERAQPHESRV